MVRCSFGAIWSRVRGKEDSAFLCPRFSEIDAMSETGILYRAISQRKRYYSERGVKVANTGSPFAPPSPSRVFLKIGIGGYAGAGKTHFALTFPKPCVQDPEHGTDMFLGRMYQTNAEGPQQAFDFNTSYERSIYEATNQVDWLIKNPDKHDRETLVVDPITLYWEAAQEAFIEELRQKIASGKSRRTNPYDIQFGDWKDIKRPYKRYLNRLLAVPMHVVLIGRMKDDYDVSGGNVEKTGTGFDAEKNTPHAVDIMLFLERKGRKRYAVVDKDRSGLFDGTVIENPSFDSFKPIMDRLVMVKEGKDPNDIQSEEDAAKADATARVREEKRQKVAAKIERIKRAGETLEELGIQSEYEKVLNDNGAADLENTSEPVLNLVFERLRVIYEEAYEKKTNEEKSEETTEQEKE
jgi:hypothetical protein